MSSTYLSLHYHIVFATKHREPTIAPAWRPRLNEYLGGTLLGLGAFPQGIGGAADHVHLLAGLKATHCLADLLRELKKASTAWVRDACAAPAFAWQEGYAFTVGPASRDAVRSYIARQEEHHHQKTFREELIEMLERAGVEYDPRYLD